MAVEQVVIDASAAIQASLADGWRALGAWRLIAPTLLWSEACSGLRQLEFRRDISNAEAVEAISRLLVAPVDAVSSKELADDALSLARQLGWAKTYDAEYVALARRLSLRFLTVDARLARTASRFVVVVGV